MKSVRRCAAAVAMLCVGGAAWGWAPLIPITTASEAQIDASQPCAVTVLRLAPDPDIVVIDFPSLTMQGMMLNRVAALVEKAQLPRDRVLDDVALNEAIINCGETVESYYYGHDYRAADLARFFKLAAADGVKLNPQEMWLYGLVKQLGWLSPGANGALITLPAAGGPITQDMRAVILHHEIAHGAFFTVPGYQAYAVAFWQGLTDAQRATFRQFLGAQGYDTQNANLMLNETQAYLVFTESPLFFTAAALGMDKQEMNGLRARFIAHMPAFWLKALADEVLPVGKVAAAVCMK
jgi:hypothetical protein